jgi:hypothetical protein
VPVNDIRQIVFLNRAVGAREQRHRNGEAKRLCCRHVEDQFDVGGFLHWKLSSLFAIEDAAGIDTGQPECMGKYRAVADETASVDDSAVLS